MMLTPTNVFTCADRDDPAGAGVRVLAGHLLAGVFRQHAWEVRYPPWPEPRRGNSQEERAGKEAGGEQQLIA